jgi:GntR family transcriptional regulator
VSNIFLRARRRAKEAALRRCGAGEGWTGLNRTLAANGPNSVARPRYLQIARQLRQAIQAGDFPVGSILPPEVQLASHYGVSRQTVREAIDQLRQHGMLTTRKRVGTRVDAAEPAGLFRYAFQSVDDLLGMAAETEMVVDGREWVTARGALAAELGCRSGQRWLLLRCRRRRPGETRPLCASDVYVEQRLAPAVATQDLFRTALFMVLERSAGEPVQEIRQEIQATILDPATATRLDAVSGAPALRIVRRYVGPGNRLIEVSITTLPADRFIYSLTIARQAAARPG